MYSTDCGVGIKLSYRQPGSLRDLEWAAPTVGGAQSGAIISFVTLGKGKSKRNRINYGALSDGALPRHLRRVTHSRKIM